MYKFFSVNIVLSILKIPLNCASFAILFLTRIRILEMWNLFNFFSFLLFRIGQFVTTEIDYAEGQCDSRGMRGMRSNAVVFFPLLERERSVLQLHRISLRATWYQLRFYASIFEKYLISAEIYRHAEITISRKAKNNRV